MTVIRQLPSDPTDLVVQGDQMRSAAFAATVGNAISPIVISPMGPLFGFQTPIVQNDETIYPQPLGGDALVATAEAMVNTYPRNNAVICHADGTQVTIARGPLLLNTWLAQGTNQFTISGTTLDKSGAALAACFVSVEETGRQNIPGIDVVAQTVSDGSGAYSVTVPGNTAYQLEAYKSGSPDLAGITKNTVTPGSVNIYLRDPTTADTGGTGGMVSSRVQAGM